MSTSSCVTSVALATLLGFAAPAGAAEPFEQPPVWRAADVLAPAMLSGPNHRVEDPVHNDGLMNLYRISSQFGAIDAQSTAELVKRLDEFNAIAATDPGGACGAKWPDLAWTPS